jgi:hypothetical protein
MTRIVLALALLLAFPAGALAATDDEIRAADNARVPTTEGVLWAAVPLADAYWTARGHPAPACGPARLYVYDEPNGKTWGRGDSDDCGIYISGKWLASVKRDMTRGYVTAWRMVGALMVHERGHNYGLGHANTGVMESDFQWWRFPEVNRWAYAQRQAARGNTRPLQRAR